MKLVYISTLLAIAVISFGLFVNSPKLPNRRIASMGVPVGALTKGSYESGNYFQTKVSCVTNNEAPNWRIVTCAQGKMCTSQSVTDGTCRWINVSILPVAIGIDTGELRKDER